MRFFIILLLASLASTSPVLKELQDKNYVEAVQEDAVLPAQFASNNHPEEHPENSLDYIENIITDFSNSVSNEDVEIESVNKAENAEANQLHVVKPLSKIDQSGESKECTPVAATIMKKDLHNLVQNIIKDFKEAYNKLTGIVNEIITSVPKATKP